MRVLVTGCAGYVGSVLTGELLCAGHKVIGVDSLLSGSAGLLANLGRKGFRFVKADVRNTDTMNSLVENSDAVVHLAAIVGDPACARQPELATSVNRDASLQLFQQSINGGVNHFVFASTCSNYGRMADPSQFVNEDSDLRPVSLYAETKVEVEKTLLASNPPIATVLRFATVFGISPRMRFDLTVNEFTRDLLTTRKLLIFGEHFWRPYIHVRDVARAILLVLTTDSAKTRGKVFNVGDDRENYQKGQLVDMIAAELGTDLEIERVQKQEDPRDYRVSFQKIARELDFKITRTVPDGIREVISAMEQNVFPDSQNPIYRN